jgi:hypothetical protein
MSTRSSCEGMRAKQSAETIGGQAPAVADNAAVPDQLSLRAALRAATSLAIDPAAIDVEPRSLRSHKRRNALGFFLFGTGGHRS